jgi:arginine decarboxylase
MLNPDIGAVVIHKGFAFHSRHDASVLRSMIDPLARLEPSDVSAMRLARVLKRVRPELDLYLLSNRRVEEIAGDPSADSVRRVFYAVEELLELHLAVLEGVQARYETPFFDNLKKYAQRPIGTFHALPIARGKSVFRSNWIRDMGEFYGPRYFSRRTVRRRVDSTVCWSRQATSNARRNWRRAHLAQIACSS